MVVNFTLTREKLFDFLRGARLFLIDFILFQGKVVIRPIAFKPAAMTPAARFGLAGERYGSTPILTRPGSRLTLYGSELNLRHC